MNLRKVRIQLTLLFGLMAAIAVAAISWFAIDQGQEGILDSAEREAESNVKDLALAQISGRDTDEFVNTWSVTITDEWREANEFSETWVEPPLFRMVERAWDWPAFQEFDQDGPWLAYSEPTTDDQDDGEARWGRECHRPVRLQGRCLSIAVAHHHGGHWLDSDYQCGWLLASRPLAATGALGNGPAT